LSRADLLDALLPVVEAFERLRVRHHIGGSVASSALGVARATLDVDLVADLAGSQVSRFVAALEEDYYLDGDAVREAVERRASFNLIHLATMVKVDVFVLKDRPYDIEAFSRMRAEVLEEDEGARAFFLASAEDTILNKLEWYEMGGRVADRQWRDVIGVLKVQWGRLDLDYLRRWARTLGLLDLLERAIGEAR
jgi:sugar/nucleoside kinase (ribokinase family)